MQIVNIGYNYRHNKNFLIDRPNGSGDYLFLLVKSPAVFILDNREVKVSGNAIILYEEGTAQNYRAWDKEFLNDWFHFTVDDMGWFEQLNLPLNRLVENFNIYRAKELSKLIMEMANEKSGQGIYSEQIMQLKLRCFLLKLSESFSYKDSEKVMPDQFEALKILRNEIYNHPYNKWNIAEISTKANMSVSNFEHVYKRIYGVSCMSDIITSRLEYSKYHLAKSNLKIKYIAEICGYENEVHFMRQFKKYVGKTPTEYRKTALGSRSRRE